MLEYLISSKARRELLKLLWGQGRKGSVSELARLAKTDYRSAHGELNKMHALGMAHRDRVGNATVFSAAKQCPDARLLRRLVALETSCVSPAPSSAQSEDDQLRAWLAHYGAPVYSPAEPIYLPRCEEVFVSAAARSRHDPAVARSLPVFVWKNRNRFNHALLKSGANRAGQMKVVGFFLELTGELTDDEGLLKSSELFRDRRWKKDQNFFSSQTQSRYSVEQCRLRTPAVARKWLFWMNLSRESFQSTFNKHVCDETV